MESARLRLAAGACAVAAVVVGLERWRRSRRRGLAAWKLVVDPGRGGAPDAYVVEAAGDPSIRYVAPDGGNRGVHGVPPPPFITQPNWDALRATRGLLRASDVVVASFPKTGTTLTEQVVLSLLCGGDAAKLDPSSQNEWDARRGHGKYWVEKVAAVPGGVESSRPTLDVAAFAAIPAPRVVKTHAPLDLFLGEAAAFPKVIYVTRDAKDACVSSYYHAANPHKRGWPFGAWAAAWAGGYFEHGTLWAHRRSWRNAPPDRVLWVTYEDLVSDPDAEIRRIAAFVGVAAPPALVAKTRALSSFDAMRETAGDMKYFYRRGTVGDAARHFDADLAADFDAIEAREATTGGGRLA